MEDIQLIAKIKSNIKDYNVNEIHKIESLLAYIIAIKPKLIVIDANVLLHFPQLKKLPNVFSFDANENNKSYHYSEELLSKFAELEIKKTDKVVAIGGGIVQDIIGYCCSVYARGIKYYLFPSTLLALCDSCIGGKTSINLKNKKNLIGTFYPPVEIIIFPDFVKTLSEKDFMSGLGEIFKFYCLQNKLKEFEKNIAIYLKRENISLLIQECIKYKGHIIEIDEFDEKERKFLNFGHTFGHAIEGTSNFEIPHGSAVVIGVIIAYAISCSMKFISEEKLNEVERLAEKLLTNISMKEQWLSFEKLLPLIKSDKKNTGVIVIVLPKNDTFILETFDEGLLENNFNFALTRLKSYIK